MAFHFRTPYPAEIEQRMRQYYHSLSEKDRRRFAAVEAIKLGRKRLRCLVVRIRYNSYRGGLMAK